MTTPTANEIRADIEARIRKLSFAVARSEKSMKTNSRLGKMIGASKARQDMKRFAGRIIRLQRLLGK